MFGLPEVIALLSEKRVQGDRADQGIDVKTSCSPNSLGSPGIRLLVSYLLEGDSTDRS